jgi:ribulose-5-phosphate 4-epimerase/fuculose-1-phosphate aldolase
VLAAVGVLPELVNQTGALFSGDLRMVEEYGGEVDSPLLGAELAEAIGDAPVAILANHGVIVTGATVAEATYRAASLDRVCRSAYDVMLLGKDPLVMPAGAVKGMKQSLLERAVDVYWAGAVRQLVKAEPEVLD